MNNYKTVPVSCNKDCGAGCALTAYIENGILIRVEDSAGRLPYMKGCLKGYKTAETVYHKKRILKPLIRTGKRGSGEFRETNWNEALDLIALKLKGLRLKDFYHYLADILIQQGVIPVKLLLLSKSRYLEQKMWV